MKLVISVAVILSFVSPICFSGASGDCNIEWQEMNHSKHKQYDLKSMHSVAITNNSKAKKSYEIRYHSSVRLIDMWQLIGRFEKKVTLAPGESFNENYTLIGQVGRSEKGSYATMAITSVSPGVGCTKYNKLKVH